MRRFLTCLSLALLCLVPPHLDARQDEPRSPRIANYVLSARLDTGARTIEGEGRLHWRNTTGTPTSELRFHLYWNAWRDDHSTWMRELRLAGEAGRDQRTDADRAAIDLTALRLVTPDGPLDVLDRLRFIAPDDENPHDRTLVSIALDQPVAPARDITLEFAWTAKVPRPYARTGVLGNYFFIAHWFPKIGVLQDDGWRAAQFHARTEFFADFGTYDVSLTVPSGWIVGATGRETSRADHDNGTTTHRYVAEDVHDFAWTTSPDFIEHRERFEAPGLPPVDLRLLLQPDHAGQADRHITAAREALKHFGERLGPFSWPNLTIVDPVTIINPRAQGGETAGMEYPTLITAATSVVNPSSDDTLEDVIVHEIGHQYFQSAVATNEVTDAWIDEGLTTFMSALALDAAFPERFVAIDRYFGGLVAWPHPDVRWSLLHRGLSINSYRRVPGWDAPITPTWRQAPNTTLYTTYVRVPLALETLRRLIGDDMMTTVLASYYTRGAFRHPTPDEFFSIVNSTAGRNLTWFFDATLRQANTFDYAVGDVVSAPAGNDAGRFDSTVIVRRLADGVFPVEVRVTFDDGSSVVERWNGETRWHAFTYERPASVSTVEVDPDRILVLDVHRTNNSWTSAPRAAGAADKWAQRWIAWMQQLLLTYAFFI